MSDSATNEPSIPMATELSAVPKANRCHGCGKVLAAWEEQRRLLLGAIVPVYHCIPCDTDYLLEEIRENLRRAGDGRE